MTTHSVKAQSRIAGIDAEDDQDYTTKHQVEDMLTGDVSKRTALGNLMSPIKDVIPSGILTDGGLTQTAPSTTGMRFIPWNELDELNRPRFNMQSQNWVAVPSGLSPTMSCCVNCTRPYLALFTTPTLPSTANFDIDIITNSSRIIFQGQAYTARVGNASIDSDVYIEHGGKLCLGSLRPVHFTSSSAATTYRDIQLNYLGALKITRNIRYIMSSSLWFQGIWINEDSTIYPGPPKPLVILDGDSWVEAMNGTWSASAGYTDLDQGDWQTSKNIEGLIKATGWKVARPAQGGTGYFNANTHDTDPDVVTTDNTVFGSQMRVNDYGSIWVPQKPMMFIMQGSANDNGSSPGESGMTDRVQDTINRYLAVDPSIQMVFISPQSKDNPDPFAAGLGAPANARGIHTACNNNPDTVIGFVNQLTYTDTDDQWDILTNADGLHTNVSGSDFNPTLWARDMRHFNVNTKRYLDCLAAAV